ERVDCRARAMFFRPLKGAEMAVLHDEVLIARRGVDPAWLEALAVTRLGDAQRCPLAKEPGKTSLVDGATMNDERDGRRQVARKQCKELHQCLHPPGGSSDGDDVARDTLVVHQKGFADARIRQTSSPISTARLSARTSRRCCAWARARWARSCRVRAAVGRL